MEVLLNKNIDINVVDYEGRTVLHHAASYYRENCLQKLIKIPQLDVSIKDNYKLLAIEYAAIIGCKIGVEVIANRSTFSDQQIHQLYFQSCMSQSYETWNFIVSYFSIDLRMQQEKTGRTCLHLATKCFNTLSGKFYSKIFTKLEKILGKEGLLSFVNFACTKKETPLHYAVLHTNKLACKFLLLNGAYILVGDSQGFTPIDYCCRVGTAELLEILLVDYDHSALSLSNVVSRKTSSLHISCSFHNQDTAILILKSLPSHHFDINSRDDSGVR